MKRLDVGFEMHPGKIVRKKKKMFLIMIQFIDNNNNNNNNFTSNTESDKDALEDTTAYITIKMLLNIH